MNVIDFKDTSKIDSKIFALVYGGSGTGKTHLMGTVGELGKVLVIDIDKGFKTIAFAKDLAKARDNITIVSFDSFKDLDQAYKLVKANEPDKWNKFFGKEVISEPFDWVIWDTWSEIQWFMLQKLRENESIAGAGLDYRKNLQIQHWGMLTDLNKLSVEALRDCNVNQIFTMQETMTKDELSGQIIGGPAIHGKLVQEMPAYFDIVVRTFVDIQGRFVATTKPKGKWAAKTRIAENKEYVNPTAKDIFTT